MLLADAQDHAQEALAELRHVVRGIGPWPARPAASLSTYGHAMRPSAERRCSGPRRPAEPAPVTSKLAPPAFASMPPAMARITAGRAIRPVCQDTGRGGPEDSPAHLLGSGEGRGASGPLPT